MNQHPSNTPRRPYNNNQPSRRIRCTTADTSLADAMSPLSISASSTAKARMSPPRSQPQRRTTPQHPGANRQPGRLQRQHSVSCCTPPSSHPLNGKLTPPQLVRFQRATSGTSSSSQSSLFAGSKFMDSPNPEHVPMPPAHWFSAVDVLSVSPARASPAPSSVSSSPSVASSFEEKSVVSSLSSGDELLMSAERRHASGFRINPLQLIAAVSAMV